MSFKENITKIPDTGLTAFKTETWKIHDAKDNAAIYGDFDPENNEDDAKLLESIKLHGAIQILTVRRDDNIPANEYVCVSGHRRLAAYKYAQIPHVPVYVIKAETEEELALMEAALVESNTMTRTRTTAIMLKEVEKLEAVYRKLKKINPEKYSGTVRSIIAEAMHVSERTVQTVQTIKNSENPDVIEEYKAGKITQKEAAQKVKKTASRPVAKTVPDEKQMEARQLPIEPPPLPPKEPETLDQVPAGKEESLRVCFNQLLKTIERVQATMSEYPEIALDDRFQKAVCSLGNEARDYEQKKGVKK